MDTAALRSAPHLSASSINDYLACGLLYKLGRIDRIPPEFRSDAMELGSCVHRVLEACYQEKMTGNILALKAMQALFEEHWRDAAEGRDDIRYAEGKDFDTLLLEGKELLAAWHDKRPDEGFTVLGIEEPFRFTIDEVPVPLIGFIDLIEEDASGTIVITDFKTSSRAYSIDEVDRNFQLTLYQMAMKRNGFGSREILLRFDALIKTKTPKFEQYYTTRGPEDEKRAIRKIQAVWQGISQGVFIPNDDAFNWRCKGCSYKNACDEWFREVSP